MANEKKYLDQTWGETYSISGETLSSNGFYTGEHKGLPMQDYADTAGANSDGHFVEHSTIRFGTLLQDATEGSMPTEGVAVRQNLVGAKPATGSEAGVYEKNASKTFTFTADATYSLSAYCKVYIGGTEGVSGTDYTYNSGAGTVAFAANKLSDDTVIDLRCKKSTEVALLQTLTKCTSDTEDGIIGTSAKLEVIYTAETGKTLPNSITVKIGGNTATASTDYTWTKATGKLEIAAAKLTGDVEVTVTAS